jgi:hypothetical protein
MLLSSLDDIPVDEGGRRVLDTVSRLQRFILDPTVGYQLHQSLPVSGWPRQLALANERAYLLTALDADQLSVVDLADGRQARPVGIAPMVVPDPPWAGVYAMAAAFNCVVQDPPGTGGDRRCGIEINAHWRLVADGDVVWASSDEGGVWVWH